MDPYGSLTKVEWPSTISLANGTITNNAVTSTSITGVINHNWAINFSQVLAPFAIPSDSNSDFVVCNISTATNSYVRVWYSALGNSYQTGYLNKPLSGCRIIGIGY